MPTHVGIPKSVFMLNRHSYHFARFKFGTMFNAWVNFLQETQTRYAASRAILNEMRTRLHTGGDYRVLIDSLRGEQIAGGGLQELLTDLADKCYNQVLVTGAFQENTGAGGNTMVESTVNVDAIIDGQFYAAIFPITADIALPAGATTAMGEFRAITVSVTAAGALIQTVSDVAAAGPVHPPPRPPAGSCPIGVFQIPEGFTAGADRTNVLGFVEGFAPRLARTAVVAPAPAALASAAITAYTVLAPEDVMNYYGIRDVDV